VETYKDVQDRYDKLEKELTTEDDWEDIKSEGDTTTQV
jgi:hypothetical protein